jgi:hypothetical protein
LESPFQTNEQPFRDFSQEHARLAERVEKAGIFILPDFRRQVIQDFIRHLWRRKNFVAAQVGQARQHVGIVIFIHRAREP